MATCQEVAPHLVELGTPSLEVILRPRLDRLGMRDVIVDHALQPLIRHVRLHAPERSIGSVSLSHRRPQHYHRRPPYHH
jgi:hypothetical protein